MAAHAHSTFCSKSSAVGSSSTRLRRRFKCSAIGASFPRSSSPARETIDSTRSCADVQPGRAFFLQFMGQSPHLGLQRIPRLVRSRCGVMPGAEHGLQVAISDCGGRVEAGRFAFHAKSHPCDIERMPTGSRVVAVTQYAAVYRSRQSWASRPATGRVAETGKSLGLYPKRRGTVNAGCYRPEKGGSRTENAWR